MKPRSARTREASRPADLAILRIRPCVLSLCDQLNLLCYYNIVRLLTFIRCSSDAWKWLYGKPPIPGWDYEIAAYKVRHHPAEHKTGFPAHWTASTISKTIPTSRKAIALYHDAAQIHLYDCDNGLYCLHHCSPHLEPGNYTGKFGWSRHLYWRTVRWFCWNLLRVPVHNMRYSQGLCRLLWILSINAGYYSSTKKAFGGRIIRLTVKE